MDAGQKLVIFRFLSFGSQNRLPVTFPSHLPITKLADDVSEEMWVE